MTNKQQKIQLLKDIISGRSPLTALIKVKSFVVFEGVGDGVNLVKNSETKEEVEMNSEDLKTFIGTNKTANFHTIEFIDFSCNKTSA